MEINGKSKINQIKKNKKKKILKIYLIKNKDKINNIKK
jgi:hypothetical protein